MNSAYVLASQIVGSLSGTAQHECLRGLKECETTQTLMAQRNWHDALNSSLQAAARFSRIPEAAPLLGITKADAAAALGNLGRHADAKVAALEGLPLVQQVRGLERSQASMHMTIGVASYLEGDAVTGRNEFAVARELCQQCGATDLLLLLDSNETALKSERESRKWWKLWR